MVEKNYLDTQDLLPVRILPCAVSIALRLRFCGVALSHLA